MNKSATELLERADKLISNRGYATTKTKTGYIFRADTNLIEEMGQCIFDMRDHISSMGEWQDISTAPRDGTHILIFDPRPDTLYEDSGIIYVVLWERARWVEACGERYMSFNPTYWQPLPLPPTNLTTEQNERK